MAGFEIVVRPVVFPSIRPQAARSLPPQDDPTKGFAVIRGNGAKSLSLPNNYSNSTTSSQHTEIRRRVDKARVYQKDDNGVVNKENFVDVDVPNKIWMKGPPEQAGGAGHGNTDPQGAGGSGGGGAGGAGNEIEIRYYNPVKKEKNIEIKKRNVIIEREQGGGGG